MNLLDALGEFGGLMIGFLLTLFVFSFVYKDNPLYRLAVHVLVGLSAAYATIVVVQQVILPVLDSIRRDPISISSILWLVPLLLSILLISKIVPSLAWIGNSSMAFLIGIGAAVGLVGAISGTLLPQIMTQYENRYFGLIVALLAICTLAYFYFTDRLPILGQISWPGWFRYVRTTGQVAITMTLAAFFAGVLSTSLVLLNERITYYLNSFSELLTSLSL